MWIATERGDAVNLTHATALVVAESEFNTTADLPYFVRATFDPNYPGTVINRFATKEEAKEFIANLLTHLS